MGMPIVTALEKTSDESFRRTHRPSPGLRSAVISDFILHDGNTLATGVVNMIAEGRTEGYSPVLIAGESGTGKSRLIEKLIIDTTRNRPETSITRISGHDLRTWIGQLRRSNTSDTAVMLPGQEQSDFDDWNHLRYQLRETDLLIIDGLEDLAGQTIAQAELGFAIEKRFYRNSGVVMTCKRLPKAGQPWSHRFLSHLSGGLVVRMGLPDDSSRRRFIMNWASERNSPVDVRVVDQLAVEPLDFGSLKGRLEQMRIKARLERKSIGPELVQSLIDGQQMILNDESPPAIREVAKLVAKTYRIKLADLCGASRLPGLVRPRHVAIWLAFQHCGISNEKICNFFGGRDPATIRHAIRQIEQKRMGDFALEEHLASLSRQIFHTRQG